GKGRTQRSAGIAGRGLEPEIIEDAFRVELAIGDAIECDAAREAQISRACFSAYAARDLEDDLFRHALYRGGDVHVELRQQFRLGLPSRRAEQGVELLVRHPEAGAIVEI